MQTIGHCSECRWWTRGGGQNDGFQVDSQHFGACRHPKLAYGHFNYDGTISYEIKPPPAGAAFLEDHYRKEHLSGRRVEGFRAGRKRLALGRAMAGSHRAKDCAVGCLELVAFTVAAFCHRR